ncbi:MAG: TrbG/VirB9 family P-type conjugative transfer protein [Neisseriaceae bacterium]
MKRLALVFLSLCISDWGWSAVNGRPSLNDHRIQHMNYVPNQVYNLYSKIGAITLVELQEDETILSNSGRPNFFSGADNSFDLKVFRNKFVFKPLRITSTDFIVLTDKRTYLFQVQPANKKHPATYHYSFNKYSGDFPSSASNLTRHNWNYWGRGDKALKPRRVWDDGKFTYFDFTNLDELPIIFSIDEKGDENQVNFHLTGKIFVVHEVNSRFFIRKDRLVLEVFKKKVKKNGK